MDDKLLNSKDIDEALKIAAFLDEPEEFHIQVKELHGLALNVILNLYPNACVNTVNDDLVVEIVTEEGTILCSFKDKLCVQAALFPHDDEIANL